MTFRIRSRMVQMMLIFITAVGLAGCGSSEEPKTASVTFAVISDPHLHDSTLLGSNGADFAAYLEQDTKLLAESSEILSAAVADLKSSAADFIIISGDLTKDGERVNHQAMANQLAGLAAVGKKVFVIPGNHDIDNPQAVSYLTSPPTPVATVSPAEFRQIYADFGYTDAISTDPNSLSYIAEPVPGLWLFAIDSCQYAANLNQAASTVAGALSPATLTWILDRLKDARTQGKISIAMMHHGSIEHLTGQSLYYPEYLLNNWQSAVQQLAESGLHLIFTGHFHATDVTRKDFDSSSLYDIETGSLITYPLSYRTVEMDLKTRSVAIQTRRVSAITSRPTDLQQYVFATFQSSYTALARKTLSQQPYSLTDPTLSTVSGRIASGMMAHFAGNESPDMSTVLIITAMQGSMDPATQEFGSVLSSLWTDLPPGDTEVSFSFTAE